MTETRVVHVNDHVRGAVYIGRAMPRQGLPASKWANPYKIGRDGTRGQVVLKYTEDLLIGERRPLLAELPELRGKPLACWCRHDGEITHPPTNGCHGDTLLYLLSIHTDDELRELAATEPSGVARRQAEAKIREESLIGQFDTVSRMSEGVSCIKSAISRISGGDRG